MPDALSDAKAALAHANAAFPSPKPTSRAVTPAASKPAAPSLGDELKAKGEMVQKARMALPKMHNGGPVKMDGDYNLQAGEHVLTEKEAKLARKHAIMASGIKSLAKAGKGKRK